MHAVEKRRTMERDLESLAAAKTAWARLPIVRKIAMLEAMKRLVRSVAPDWVSAASNAKGLLPNSPLEGEEWISGPWAVMYALTRYARTLSHIDGRGEPRLPRTSTDAEGCTIVHVFPHDLYDRLLLNGIRAEVRMQTGITPAAVRASAAAFYRLSRPEGRVALVLGAGNISSIAPLDVLYKMFGEGAVCMLKMNPVNDYLGPILERAMHPLVDAGFLRFAYGGPDVGAYLCEHPAIDTIHVTGSEATFSAIAAQVPQGKTITGELGNVSPAIVLPGKWTADDVRFQAENIATQKAHNAGFNCIGAQVLILPSEWDLASDLRSEVERVLADAEARPEYYPGASERRAALAGSASPLRTVVDVDPSDVSNPLFTGEAFCGVLACVRLPGDLAAFARNAVSFANERLRGSLGAVVVADPQTQREHAQSLGETVRDLRYGCVGVNAWTGVGYFITETPWGAYPGHTLADPGSGMGVVHNSYFLEGSEKSVVYAPFAPFPRNLRSREYALLPRPPWFITNAMQSQIGRALCDFELTRTPAAAARVAALALRG